jgi:hypothetical protein
MLAILLIICLINLLVFLFSKEDKVILKKVYLKHSYILLIGFLIVFFQVPVEFLFKKIDFSDSFLIPNPNYFYKTVTLASISFISFLFGYTIIKKKKKTYSICNINNRKLMNSNTYFLSIGSVISFFIYLYFSDKSYFLGGYYYHEFTPIMVYSNVLFTSLTYAYLIQKSINLRGKYQRLSFKRYLLELNPVVQLIILVYCILILLSGDRGPLMNMVMVYLACFIFARSISLKLKIIIPGLALSILLIMFIGITRNPLLYDLSLIEKIEIVNQKQKDSEYLSPSTLELAASFRTINVAVAEIPESQDFFYGEFFVKNIFSVIPGLSQVFINLFFPDNPSYRDTSAAYITYLIQGQNPRYGDGTSCISDIYMDFGLTGILFFFILFGGFIRKMEVVMYDTSTNNSLFSIILSISYFALAINISRGSIFTPLNVAVRILIFIYLNSLFQKNKIESASKTPKPDFDGLQVTENQGLF